MCLGRAQEPRHRLLTLADPRANDCISRRHRRRSGRHKESGQRAAAGERAAWEASGAPSVSAGRSPGSGPGAPEAYSGDEAAAPLAGASRCQGPRTKLRSAGGAAPRAEGGACTCIARRALALPGASTPLLRRSLLRIY